MDHRNLKVTLQLENAAQIYTKHDTTNQLPENEMHLISDLLFM